MEQQKWNEFIIVSVNNNCLSKRSIRINLLFERCWIIDRLSMQIFIVFEILEIWSLSNDLDKLEQPKILEHRISKCDDLWVDTIWLSIFIIVLQLQKEKKEKLTRKWKKKLEEFFQEISNPFLLPNIFLSNIYSYLL